MAGTLLAALAFAAHAAPAGAAGGGAGFELAHAKVRPGKVFFAAQRRAQVRFRFRAERRVTVVVKLVRKGKGPIRRWTRRSLAPGKAHEIKWDGRARDRSVPADGRYAFRIGPAGHRGAPVGSFRFADHRFPVAGPHTYGDRFGEPRSGGRVHEGQDLPSPCGTRLVAARGGRVQARGYSHSLYGHWVLIDGAATRRDYFYSHLRSPTPLADGERVHTGERVGTVGKTGNARTEFCQLHFELWPSGYRNGRPQDPLPMLRRWDEVS